MIVELSSCGGRIVTKKRATTQSASRILFDRLYRDKPRRIAALNQTRRELSLGRQIRELREGKGLSQAQLARALGTQAPAISRIEDADYDGHSLRILRKIAEYFDQELIVAFKPQRALATTR
jgi:DNA-binding XRE family transcriptional regulator